MSKLAWTAVLATLLAAPAAAQNNMWAGPHERGGNPFTTIRYEELTQRYASPAQQRLLAAVQGGRTHDRTRPMLQKRQKVLAKARHPHMTQTGNRAY
jgi:hypothetical protein